MVSVDGLASSPRIGLDDNLLITNLEIKRKQANTNRKVKFSHNPLRSIVQLVIIVIYRKLIRLSRWKAIENVIPHG